MDMGMDMDMVYGHGLDLPAWSLSWVGDITARYIHTLSPLFFSLFFLYKDFLGLGVVEVLKISHSSFGLGSCSLRLVLSRLVSSRLGCAGLEKKVLLDR
jgi:hypothetical protein